MINKNSKPPLQFTQLTTDDIHKHRKDYTMLLINSYLLTLEQKGIEMMQTDKRFYDTFK